MIVCPNPKCDHGYVDVSTTLGHIDVAGEYYTETTWWRQACPDCDGEQDETKEKEEENGHAKIPCS